MTYDATGRRTGFTDASGTSTWTWDSLGRRTSVKDGSNKTVSYGYDLADQQTSITYPGGTNKVTRHYDAAGRIDWIQDYKSNKTTFAYDADSNLKTVTRPGTSGLIDSFSYSPTQQVIGIKTAKGTSTLAEFSYTRDGSDFVATSATVGIAEPAQSNVYDDLGRLTATGPAGGPIPYVYDPTGNLTQRGTSSLTYDDTDQLCWQTSAVQSQGTCSNVPSGATTFRYDPSGNRTARVASGTTTTYSYDDANQLKSYNGTASYVYADGGLRASKTISGAKTTFTWDRTGEEPKLLSDGTINYVYGPDGHLLEQIGATGTVTYVHHDQLGSTRLLTSSSGAKVGTYNYDAYGAVVAKTGSATTPLQYTGEYTDSESGLVYLRARYYDPATAQFINVDPAIENTRAAYAYADGNPINSIDPDGLKGKRKKDRACAPGGDAVAVASGRKGAKPRVYPSCATFVSTGKNVTTAVQVNPKSGTLQWSVFAMPLLGMFNSYDISIRVGKRQVDHKLQPYWPHGSLPRSVAKPGNILTISGSVYSAQTQTNYTGSVRCRIPR